MANVRLFRLAKALIKEMQKSVVVLDNQINNRVSKRKKRELLSVIPSVTTVRCAPIVCPKNRCVGTVRLKLPLEVLHKE